jgi:hypothetical protein
MAWTKAEFIEFCTKCGVDPSKALQEGRIDLRDPKEIAAPFVKTAENMNKKVKRRKANAHKNMLKVQDSERESDQAVALGQEICRQDGRMEATNGRIRLHVTGLRVRPYDEDNFAAGCKGIIDGLVESGIIPRDDWKTLQVSSSQEKVSDWAKEGTVIDIWLP